MSGISYLIIYDNLSISYEDFFERMMALLRFHSTAPFSPMEINPFFLCLNCFQAEPFLTSTFKIT